MSIRPRCKFKKVYIRHVGKYNIEKKLIHTYGLRNKAEIKKAEYLVNKYLTVAKIYSKDTSIYKNSIFKLLKKGILKQSESVLDLNVNSVLARRLQTIVQNKFNITPLASRQLITSGKIFIKGIKYKIPSHILDLAYDEHISLTNNHLGG